jgi:hypothetical protein
MRFTSVVLTSLFCLISETSLSQFTISYHRANYSFVGINTSVLKKRVVVELRVGAFPNNDFPVEFDLLYKILSKPSYELYGGVAAVREPWYWRPLIPAGINCYPFGKKRFGFHLEVAAGFRPINDPFEDFVVFNSWAELRSSIGFRYRFLKRNKPQL